MDGAARPAARGPAVVPPYLVVLLVAALAGVALLHVAGSTFHEAKAAGEFPPDVRRRIAFAVIFNAGLAGALALAAAGEIVATAVRLFRRVPPVRTAGRLAVALLLMVVFIAGHRLANPWLADVVRAVRGAAPAPAATGPYGEDFRGSPTLPSAASARRLRGSRE